MTAPDPNAASPKLSLLQADEVAGYCLQALGPTQVLLVGAALAPLLTPLRAAGCGVVVHEEIPVDIAATGTVIAWAESCSQCRSLFELGANVLVLVAAATPADEAHAISEQAAAANWQRHPAMFVLPASRDGIRILMLVRAGVSVADPQSILRAGYHGLAAALVRPSDAVVAADAADHGLWRILQQHTRCRSLQVLSNGPAPADLEPGIIWQAPAALRPDEPLADVVVTRIGHDDMNWMRELKVATAALVRSGRLVAAVPLIDGRNVDERGLLFALESLGLVVDRAWWQSLSRPVGAGQFIEASRDGAGRLQIDPDAKAQADALVLMAVKTGGSGVPRNPELHVPNIIAFQRDYLDASVVRLIVAMGLRLESAPLRRLLAEQLLAASPTDSADHGAALCVLLYDPAALEGERRAALLEAAQRYVELTANNPTVLRWQVSLTYAIATLHHAAGDLGRAEDLYAQVLTFDVLAFSPLLGTKTTAAAVRLGWILFARGDLPAARQAWLQGLSEARRLASHADWTEVVGDIEFPETFGMPEFAAVVDEAGRLASALRVTAETPLRPGVAWQWGNQSVQATLSRALGEQQRLLTWQEQLQDAKDWLDGQYHHLKAELERSVASLRTLQAANAALARDNAGSAAAFRLAHQHAEADKAGLRVLLQDQQAQYVRLAGEHACLTEEHARLAEEHARLAEEQARLAEEHAHLAGEHARLLDAAQELTSATSGIMDRVPQPRLPAESIAEELFRLSEALNRIPWKSAVRPALHVLVVLLGGRKRT